MSPAEVSRQQELSTKRLNKVFYNKYHLIKIVEMSGILEIQVTMTTYKQSIFKK